MRQMAKTRLDLLLVARGLAPSREKARALIMAGQVLVEGQTVIKPSATPADGATVELLAPPRYVSRGGLKLEHALSHFSVPTKGVRALDVGASTGGFSDCLLQHGAASVLAVDVGKGQLAWSLRNDPRITVQDGINARDLSFLRKEPPFDLIVMDVSFISQRLIWPQLVPLMGPDAWAVSLVKPQFEVGREQVGRGGIVRDDAAREASVESVAAFVRESAGLHVIGVTPSPILGREGNQEFLLCARNCLP
jgi:23S rRNA (cytidine1920-2'-O)/16S rRNA (cytidine1409-2'-O)-methyltransferase